MIKINKNHVQHILYSKRNFKSQGVHLIKLDSILVSSNTTPYFSILHTWKLRQYLFHHVLLWVRGHFPLNVDKNSRVVACYLVDEDWPCRA